FSRCSHPFLQKFRHKFKGGNQTLKAKRIFLRIGVVRNLIRLSKSIRIPGFDGVPLFEVTKFFFRGIMMGGITIRASSLAFNFFLALFPAIIFFFSLIPYIPIQNFQEELLTLIQEILPDDAFEVARTTIEDIVIEQRGGLLSVTFVFTLLFATNGIDSMIDGFNRTYHVIESRSWLRQRLVAFNLTIILVMLFIVAIVLIIFSEVALNYLMKLGIIRDYFVYYLLIGGKWLVLMTLFLITISFSYYYAPAKKKTFRFISAGSTLATILSLTSSVGFTFYVNNFGQYNKLYGSLGTLIVILLWIYINSLVLIIGFELNASIERARNKDHIPMPNVA
ncbi:MAG: YihY/virulence factor BrkB family protein, partial [Bacteroidia bacterium]